MKREEGGGRREEGGGGRREEGGGSITSAKERPLYNIKACTS